MEPALVKGLGLKADILHRDQGMFVTGSLQLAARQWGRF
jgi:hypothetical protein